MANIGSMDNTLNLFKEAIAELMEKGLDTELNNVWLHYKNTDTGNSRNGCSSKRLRTNFGEVDVSVPRDRKGEFEPQVLKKNQTASARTFRRKSCLCTPRV